MTLPGLDPHQDTLVEILHVVLLGFVKYFWHDLVQNQVNDDQKKTLITRIDSLNVEGLGILRPSGTTLVTYAGSLTGRYFRIISQVAPFVIYDMVPPEVFDAWYALSTLVPLIWQPVIEDIDEYCVSIVLFLWSCSNSIFFFRQILKLKSKIFSSKLSNGPALGSIKQSSTYFYISQTTYAALALPSSSSRRPSSHSMLSSGLKAFTAIDRLLRLT